MLVFELPLQIGFLVSVSAGEVSEQTARLLDRVLQERKGEPDGQGSPIFCPYTFDQPYPLEAEHIYMAGKIYTVRIRTISQELAEFFIRRLPGQGNGCLQVLGGELRLIPRYVLERSAARNSSAPMPVSCGAPAAVDPGSVKSWPRSYSVRWFASRSSVSNAAG